MLRLRVDRFAVRRYAQHDNLRSISCTVQHRSLVMLSAAGASEANSRGVEAPLQSPRLLVFFAPEPLAYLAVKT